MDIAHRTNTNRAIVSRLRLHARHACVLLVVITLAMTAAMPLCAAPPQKVASVNLCTDQLALVLADPGQLVSVTWLAHRDYENPYFRAAQTIPANYGQAEELLRLDADLYLAGPYTARQAVAVLRRFGKRVLEVDSAETIEAVRTSIRLVAAALGADERGASVIDAMDARLARAATGVAPLARPKRAAIYWPGGAIAGSDTLPGALLTYLGIGNVASKRGPHAWSSLPLEEVIVLKPDLIIVSEYDAQASLRRRAGQNTAYRKIATRSATVQSAWWNCGSPALALAAEQLARQLQVDAARL